jgi:hypothetical protein
MANQRKLLEGMRIWEGELVNRLDVPKELRYAQPKWTPTTVIDEVAPSTSNRSLSLL